MSKELTLKEKLLHLRGKYFPEKQLFLRSEGRVRFLTIGTNTQIGMASVLAISLVWGAVTSYAYLTRDILLEEKNREISNISAQYQTLSSDFGSLEEEVENRAKQLEERQAFLEGIVGSDEDNQSVAPTPTAGEPAIKTGANEGSGKKESNETSFFDEFLGTKAAHAEIITTNARRRLLLTRLENMNKRQLGLVDRLLEENNAEFTNVQAILAPTKLSAEYLLSHFDGDTAAMGGPYLPAQGFQPVFNANDHKPFAELIAATQRLEMVTMVLDSFPVGIPAEKYYVSSKFGRRRDPLKKTWARHPGLDLAGWPGTAIYATAPGKVVHAGWFGPYGRMVEIEHGNGFKTRYGHMRKLRVKKGEEVTVGTRVGDMGKTGRVTGTHLHYEVWFDDKVRDPAPFMKAAKDVLKIQGRDEKTSK